jgi:hypothetical protein
LSLPEKLIASLHGKHQDWNLGAVRAICLAASSPFIPGMNKSKITQCGAQLLDSCHGGMPIVCFATDPPVKGVLD